MGLMFGTCPATHQFDTPMGLMLGMRRATHHFDIGRFKAGRGAFQKSKHAFCQSKVCIEIDALRPAACFQFFLGPAWAPRHACLPYGPLYGETANGSFNVGPTTPMGLMLGMCPATHQFDTGNPLKGGRAFRRPKRAWRHAGTARKFRN